MLSYRHSFHAGNHADVLKHTVLVALLRHFLRKDKPFTYLDSHSGAGRYDLGGAEAVRTGEAATGIARLWDTPPEEPLLADYLTQVQHCNPDQRLTFYPGSPALALGLMRDQDRACLIELHNNEVAVLRQNFQADPRVAIHHRDACEGLLALTPPAPRRGLALIDPAYEMASDYTDVEHIVRELHRKWAVGTLALWYPLLAKQRDRSSWLKQSLARSPLSSLLCVELTVQEQRLDYGMHGSGLLIVNAPWQLDTQLNDALTALRPLLHPNGTARVQWLREPA